MKIVIETPGNRIETNLAELTRDERSALASLLGVASVRNELFQAFRDAPKFRKISGPEVFQTCPKNARFPLELELAPAESDVAEPLTAMVLEYEPSAFCRVRAHTLGGWCPKCKQRHSVTRLSLLVTLEQEGILYSKLFEV